ncbi:LacI family DNA-binding transcriptional regulator [Oleiharenicola sp. Vm1]|uniref:LacI family DNA-binding transcriptional regulator n=1 Tax=Oleiharenicola sp. Vm1 TaxID=3398393 RepID=UPI0039F5F34A
MASVTMATIARELKVSKNTVSLALRHDPQIPPATRARVHAAAQRLGYARNPVVAHLMAELRKQAHGRSKHTLAVLNAHRERDAFRTHPTIPTYVAGIRRRAEAQGYGIDEFWLHDPQLDGPRLNRILRARGIRGVIVVGLMEENRLPERFASTWRAHTCVVTGVRTHEPTLSFCCVDHHALVLQACERALALGYRRPALVIDERIDRLVEGRFTSGMMIGQLALPARDRVPAFTAVEAARGDPREFYAWLDREKPDVVFTLYRFVRRLIEARGVKIPRDLGLLQLERRAGDRDWAGMDQHNDRTGEAAVDMVISHLHNNECGVPEFPRATLIGASWQPGKTLRRVRRGAAKASA